MKPLYAGDHRSWQGTYIQIVYVSPSKTGKTHIWNIQNGDTVLGQIKWFTRWRKYGFFPGADTVFETVCLNEIDWFLKMAVQLMTTPFPHPPIAHTS